MNLPRCGTGTNPFVSTPEANRASSVILGHAKRAESRLVPGKEGGDAGVQQPGLISQAAFLKSVSFGAVDYFRIIAAVCVIYHE